MSNPFLSIVTRCYKRPKMLYRCLESISEQTDDDYENVIVVDRIGLFATPGGWDKMGQHLLSNSNRVRGKYVFMIDDDDYLMYPDFIKELKIICKEHEPDVVLIKMIRDWQNQIFPSEIVWGKKPVKDHIGTPCFVVKRELWMNYICEFVGSPADFLMIDAIFKSNPKVYWWDKIITCITQVGHGKTE